MVTPPRKVVIDLTIGSASLPTADVAGLIMDDLERCYVTLGG